MKMRIALAASVAACALSSPAFAQDQEATEVETTEAEVNEIIVTGVIGQANRLDSSVSVSTVGAQQIENLAPNGTSEIFRYIPGIRSESSAGGGNSNISARGLPVFTGGGQFVSQQIDGLPVTLFGDHNFAPTDGFIKVDSTLDRIEAVRGGTASTLTTNGNGAIINLITKTGREEGGSIVVSKGIDFRDTRIDAEFGGPIAEDLYIHVGGHYQLGGDVRNSGFNAVDGGQIQASLTRDFDSGFVRVYGRFIDKRDATYLPQAVVINGAPGSAAAFGTAASSGQILGTFGEGVPGLSANNNSLHNANLIGLPDIDGDGTLRNTDLREGFHTKTTAIGFEAEFELAEGLTINNKARYQDISGVFLSPFTHAISDADTLLAARGGTGPAVFQNGANAGTVVTSASLTQLTGNNLITEVTLFDTEFEDMGNFVNDLRITQELDVGGGNLTLAGGYFKMIQNFQQDWHWGRFLVSTENDAALIDIPGVTENGVDTFNGGFGSCCNILWDLQADVDAVYGGINYAIGNLTLDGSVRWENMDYSGFARFSTARAFDVNNDGIIGPAEQNVALPDPSTRGVIDGSLDDIAFSIGANYLFNDDLSVFARYSQGTTWNFDRQFGAFNAGTDGSIALPFLLQDRTKQFEVGMKWQESGNAVPGDLDLYITYFHGEASLNNVDITQPVGMQALAADFSSDGIELEFNWRIGGFNLNSNATWTDASIDAFQGSPQLVGNTPRRQADLIYNINAAYTFEDVATFGVGVNGTTSAPAEFANNFDFPAYALFNAFLNVNVTDSLTASINANNLFDEIGFTEGIDGRAFDTSGDGALDVAVARSVTGRTISASLKFEF